MYRITGQKIKMTITVIKVNKDDLTTINLLIANLIENSNTQLPSKNHLEKLLSDDRTYLLTAVVDNKVIGYALAYKFPSLFASDYLAYLYDIEVFENYRRRGAGRSLIEALLIYLKSDGVSMLWLGTGTNNVEGQALFISTGGIKSGETFNDFIYEIT